MSERGDYWKELGFDLNMNGAWFGVDHDEQRIVVSAPRQYREGKRDLVLGPQLIEAGRMAKRSYEAAKKAIGEALEANYTFFKVDVDFYSSQPNRDAQSNRIWWYSKDLVEVTVVRSGANFWAETSDAFDEIRRGETSKSEYKEGKVISVVLRGRERNPAARRDAIELHGLNCSVCKMTFGERYGEIGEGYIHVHHVKPLKHVRVERVIDIAKLKPVCPNCHAMLHRQDPPLKIKALKKILKRNKKRNRKDKQ